jgi:hypothetical protein
MGASSLNKAPIAPKKEAILYQIKVAKLSAT